MTAERIDIHVSADGSPSADGSRGYPADGLHTAMKLIRMRRQPGQRAVVWIGGGIYRQQETLILSGADSFTSFVAADPSHPPVFKGSIPLDGWRRETLNGYEVWTAPSPVQKARCLYIDGERAPRPRYPVNGRLRIEDQEGLDPAGNFVGTLLQGASAFRYRDGDIPPLTAVDQVEVVVPHYWVQERMPVRQIDREQRIIECSRRSIFALRDDAAERFASFYLDNVLDSLGDQPTAWYLDPNGSATGGESPVILLKLEPSSPRPQHSEVSLCVLDTFVRLAGSAVSPVREVRFEGLHFDECDFSEAPPSRAPFGVREDPMLPLDVEFAADVQAASTVPGAIQYSHARACALVNCSISRVGGYGVSLEPGSRGNLISGCHFHDLGAGAINCGGSHDPLSEEFNRDNSFSDNVVERGGRSYPNCVAVLFRHGSHNLIAHNEISDFYYTGISVGWAWGYVDSPSHANLVVGNHVHHLGQEMLNDMGGIYLLGIAPGTVVKGNHIHDVRCANYGGWGIYLDEGSSHVVVEGNVVHDVSSQAFHVHYGRENIVRNNTFAFGGGGQVAITRPEDHVSFTFERNIVVGAGMPAFLGAADQLDVVNYRIYSDLNLFWDTDPQDNAVKAGIGRRQFAKDGAIIVMLAEGRDHEWAAMGHDHHSLTLDPRFIDIQRRDLLLQPGSPAFALGITPPDVSAAGPRPVAARKHFLATPTRRQILP